MKTTTYYPPKKFAFHENVKDTPPQNGMMVEFFNRLCDGKTLTREEKNTLFHNLESQHHKGYYRLAGWAFNFKQFMNRYLVKYNHEGWQEIYAFDKTCIRSSFYTNSGIIEIIQV